MTGHPIVVERLADLDADAVRLDAAETAARARVAAAMDPHHEALDVWQRESEAAVLEGRDPPPRPVEPALDDATKNYAAVFLSARQTLRERRARFLREIAPDVDAETRERADVLTTEIRKALTKTRPMIDELVALAGARGAVGLPVERRDPADVLHAVAAGVDVFDRDPARPADGMVVFTSSDYVERPGLPPDDHAVAAVRAAQERVATAVSPGVTI